jgi:hypothetical protein
LWRWLGGDGGQVVSVVMRQMFRGLAFLFDLGIQHRQGDGGVGGGGEYFLKGILPTPSGARVSLGTGRGEFAAPHKRCAVRAKLHQGPGPSTASWRTRRCSCLPCRIKRCSCSSKRP